MIRAIIILALASVLFFVLKVLVGVLFFWMRRKAGPMRGRGPLLKGEMVQDPACGLYLPKENAVRARVGGETRFFCSDQCAERYRRGERVAGSG